jgi:hypothetical protein
VKPPILTPSLAHARRAGAASETSILHKYLETPEKMTIWGIFPSAELTEYDFASRWEFLAAHL